MCGASSREGAPQKKASFIPSRLSRGGPGSLSGRLDDRDFETEVPWGTSCTWGWSAPLPYSSHGPRLRFQYIPIPPRPGGQSLGQAAPVSIPRPFRESFPRTMASNVFLPSGASPNPSISAVSPA